MFRKPTLTAVVTLTLVTAAPFAAAQQPAPPVLDKWQSVVKTETQEALVNTASIVVVGAQLEARVKQNFAQPQPSPKKDLPLQLPAAPAGDEGSPHLGRQRHAGGRRLQGHVQ